MSMNPEERDPIQQPQPSPAEVNALLALYNTRRYAEAESRTRALLGKYPEFGFGWKLLGGALQMQGKDALAASRKVVELLPGDAEAHFNLGNILKELGQLDAALASYRNAVVVKPDFALVYYSMGNMQQGLGQLDAAVFSYRRAIQIKTDFAEAHTSLGSVLKDLDQFEASVASYRRALELRQDDAEAHARLGLVLQKFGQLDAAEASFHNALEINEKCINALLGTSRSCVVKGEINKAEETIKKVLEIQPNNLKARLELASVKKSQAGDENLVALLAVKEAAASNQVTLSNQMAIHLNFVLGKCFDDLSDHDQAFSHFMEGCKLKRSTYKYDPEKQTQFVDDVIRVFSQATIERLHGGGNPSSLPIFVLGMPRSGTTLIEQFIAGHPEVRSAGELPNMTMIAQRSSAESKARFPNNMLAINQADFGTWATDYVDGLQNRAPGAKHIIDKTPTNFFFVGLINLMLPNAKIIHVNRNPIDTCLSCFMQLFNRGHEHTYDLSELGRYYADYSRLMTHWRGVLPAGSFLDVKYERIVADKVTEVRRIIDFCGLDWNDSCLDFHKLNRTVNTASMMQVRQPIYNSSVERWRSYEKYLGPLLDVLSVLEPNNK